MTSSEIRFYRQAVRQGNLAALDLFFKDFDSKDAEERTQLIVGGISEAPDLRVLRHLVTQGIPLDYVDGEKRNTLLHLAACSDCPDVPEFFIMKGLDVNARNSIGATPLMFGSCYTSNPKVLQALLKAGADIHARDNDNASVLCIASRYSESEEVINFLVRQGLDLEGRDDAGLTPFLSAVRYNSSLPVLFALRDAGADIYAKTPDGDNALHLAALNGDCSRGMIDALRGRFRTSDANNNGYTPLTFALVFSDNPVVIDGLLKSQRDEVLYDACQNRNPRFVAALKARGIDLNAQMGDYRYPIMLVAKYNENPAVMEEFLEAGAIIDVRDLWGRTVLHYAAMNENSAIYEWLKEQDCHNYLDVEDEFERKPDYYRQNPEDF